MIFNVNVLLEIQMVDTTKHLLRADSEEERDEWIKHLHRVAVSIFANDMLGNCINYTVRFTLGAVLVPCTKRCLQIPVQRSSNGKANDTIN